MLRTTDVGATRDVYTTSKITIRRDDLASVLLPILRGTVFHVTSDSAFEQIEATGIVYANAEGEFPFTFPQSASGFGRRRGYVCLFDLREATDDQLRHALDGYYFLNPFGRKQNPAFLIMSPASHVDVIHWSATRGDYGEMWIPYVEGWYPRNMPLSVIDKVVLVEVEHPPVSSFELAVEASRERSS
jgi:hypothetical protein